jgi:hypothetical protein
MAIPRADSPSFLRFGARSKPIAALQLWARAGSRRNSSQRWTFSRFWRDRRPCGCHAAVQCHFRSQQQGRRCPIGNWQPVRWLRMDMHRFSNVAGTELPSCDGTVCISWRPSTIPRRGSWKMAPVLRASMPLQIRQGGTTFFEPAGPMLSALMQSPLLAGLRLAS